MSALTPTTYVGESGLGADMITRRARPCVMCSRAWARSVNLPVLSTTYSTPNCCQFMFLGSRSEIRLMWRWLLMRRRESFLRTMSIPNGRGPSVLS